MQLTFSDLEEMEVIPISWMKVEEIKPTPGENEAFFYEEPD